jgi:catechol 2,3-dioxygenase-like lactoylglutathione lyase family enzyme
MTAGAPQLLVNVDVPDLARAERFYTAALGLTVGRRFGDAAVELLGAAAPIYLLASPAGSSPFSGATETRRYERHWTPIHLDFAVGDLDAALARAEAAGARRDLAVRQHAWGRLAVLSDPFGHGLCLLQFEGAGYDAIATAP